MAGRAGDVAAIYAGQDSHATQLLLEKYGVRYGYLGSREREKDGISSLSQSSDFLAIVFQENDVIVYEYLNAYDQP